MTKTAALTLAKRIQRSGYFDLSGAGQRYGKTVGQTCPLCHDRVVTIYGYGVSVHQKPMVDAMVDHLTSKREDERCRKVST